MRSKYEGRYIECLNKFKDSIERIEHLIGEESEIYEIELRLNQLIEEMVLLDREITLDQIELYLINDKLTYNERQSLSKLLNHIL